jgi:hypothetical protein
MRWVRAFICDSTASRGLDGTKCAGSGLLYVILQQAEGKMERHALGQGFYV